MQDGNFSYDYAGETSYYARETSNYAGETYDEGASSCPDYLELLVLGEAASRSYCGASQPDGVTVDPTFNISWQGGEFASRWHICVAFPPSSPPLPPLQPSPPSPPPSPPSVTGCSCPQCVGCQLSWPETPPAHPPRAPP